MKIDDMKLAYQAHSTLNVNLNRQAYGPLDLGTVFKSLADLEYYRSEGTLCADTATYPEHPYPYAGQIVSLVDNDAGTVQIYKLVPNFELSVFDKVQIDAAIKPADLPIATDTTLGAIKVGEGLEIAADGTLSAQKLTVDQKVDGNTTSENPASTKAVYDWSLSTLDTAATTAQNKVDAFNASLTGSYLPTNYLSVGVANSPDKDDKLMKRSEVEAKINALDVATTTLAASKTIKTIGEEDGKISVEIQDIAIEKSQVNGLTDDLDGINTKITGLQTISSDHETRLTAAEGDIDTLESKVGYIAGISADLSGRLYAAEQSITDTRTTLNTVSADYLKRTDFASLSNDIGLSNAVADASPVATQKYVTTAVADIAGAMHFRGVTTSELATGSKIIPAGVSYYDASATPPKVPKAGDMVINATTAKEFIWAGNDWNADPEATDGRWVELGDEKIYLTKAEFSSLSTAWLTGTFDPFKSAVQTSVDNLSTYAKGLSDDLYSEQTIRYNNDQFLSGKIDNVTAALADYALSDDVESISGSLFDKIVTDVEAEAAIRKADDDYLSGQIKNVVKDLSDYALSSDVTSISGSLFNKIADEETARSTADSTLNDKITAILTAYLSAIKINDVEFEYTRENALATLSIGLISCGGAN